MEEWDAVVVSRDRSRMVSIRGKVGLASPADQIADAVIANPKGYGFFEPSTGLTGEEARGEKELDLGG